MKTLFGIAAAAWLLFASVAYLCGNLGSGRHAAVMGMIALAVWVILDRFDEWRRV